MSSCRLVITTSGFGGFLLPVLVDFYFRFWWISTSGLHMPSTEVITRATGLTAREDMDIPVRFFHLRHA